MTECIFSVIIEKTKERQKNSMKKRTIKIIISVAASVVVLTAGIVAATGNYLQTEYPLRI